MNRNQARFLIVVAIVAAAALVATVAFAGRSGEADGRIQVVATFYPLAYMAQAIGGDYVSVKTLIPYNTEVHSWQPSVSDMLSVANAEIVIFNGAGLEPWLEEKVFPSINMTGKILVNTTEGLELLPLHGEEESEDHGHAGEFDPHTWISPYMAVRQAEKIFGALVQADPEHEEYYQQRWSTLKSELLGLDLEYQRELANNTRQEIIVSHGAFGYLASRYGFEQHSVIGISADRQPSLQEMASLVQLMMSHNISVLYVDPAYTDSYIVTLKNELARQTGMDVKVMKLYLALGPIDGKDYLGQLRANLESLKAGLVDGQNG